MSVFFLVVCYEYEAVVEFGARSHRQASRQAGKQAGRQEDEGFCRLSVRCKINREPPPPCSLS